MPDLQSVQFAKAEAQRIEQEMQALQDEAKKQVEMEFKGLSMELTTIDKTFSNLYKRYSTSTDEAERDDLRQKLEVALNNKRQTLQRGVLQLDVLSSEIISAFGIQVEKFDRNATQQALLLVDRQRKELRGQPVPILDDEELEKKLEDVAQRKANAQEAWRTFEGKLTAFQEEHKDTPLSPPAKDSELAKAQNEVIEQGKKALHYLHLIGAHVKEIQAYLTDEKAQQSDTLKEQPDLLNEAVDLQKSLTSEFMRLLRGGKVSTPLPKLEDLKTKEQLDTALSGLKSHEVLTTEEPPSAGGNRDHSLFWNYAELLSSSKEVLKSLKNAAEKPNAAQQALLGLRQRIQSWLAQYEKADVEAMKHGDELSAFAVKLKDLLSTIQKSLVNIGGFVIQKDTFPEVIEAYKLANEKLSEGEGLFQRYGQIEASLETLEADSDAYKELQAEMVKVVERFMTVADETDAAVKTFIKKASHWAEVHESEKEAVGWRRKQEELYQKSQELYLRSYALDSHPTLNFRTFKGLRKVLPQEYKADKDQLLKTILSTQKELKKLGKEGKHRNARFTKLGDLNNAIQEWDFQHRFYREEDLEDSLAKVKEARSYFESEFELVKAQKSMKTLKEGMNERLYNFAKSIEKLEKKPEKGARRAKLIFAATELIEFLDLWESNFQKASKLLGDEIGADLKKKQQEYKELRSLILEQDLGEFTQSDVNDSERIETLENSKAKLRELAVEQNSLSRKELRLQDKFDAVDKPDEDSSEEEREKYAAAKKALEDFQTELQELIEKRESIEAEVESLEEELYGFQGSASQLFARLHQGYENLEVEYDAKVDVATNNQRWINLSQLLQLISDWRKTVIDPEALNLTNTHEEVLRMEADLLRSRESFLKKDPERQDELYPRIEQAWKVAEAEGIDKPLAKKDKSKEALQQLLYIQKLIAYWRKENPIVSKNKAEQKKRKQLDSWEEKAAQDIKSGRFGLLQIAAQAEEVLKEAEELLVQLAIDAQDRRKDAEGRQVYNVDEPASFQATLNWCTATEQKLKDWDGRADAIRSEDDVVKMKDSATEWYVEITEYYRDSQLTLGNALKATEQLAFAGLSDGDYDYENSGSFSPEQIALMNKMMEQAITRAQAILNAGGSFEEAQATVAHIPTAVLPDTFIEQLRAFALTDKALREEREEQAQENATKALGLHDIILDKDLNANMGLVVSRLAGLDSLTTYQQWSEKDSKYESLYLGSDTGTAQAHKVVANVGNFLDTAFASIAAFNQIDEALSKEEKRKMAADYLFKGELNFSDEGSDVGNVQNPKDKLISDRKRAVLLAGMNVVAKISGTIDNTAGTYLKEVAPEFSATMKSVSLFFTEAANLINATAKSDEIARSTEQLWQNRAKTFEIVAKGLLATGTGIAKTATLFGEIPAGILPGLGIATNALNLSINIKGIAEKMVLNHKTKQLQAQARLVDRSYIGPLQQEISSLNRRITKQSIEAGTDALALAGNIVDAAGVTYGIGTAITLVAGALKAGNELVFTGINEAQMKKARDLLKKAQNGDRQAKIDIMQESPVYAKMFIAIGATEDPPNAIALEFIRQRGITERDIKNAGTSTMIVRRFLRKQLLTKSEEEDSHEGKRMLFKALAAKFKAWRAEVQAKKNLWSGKRKDYATLTSLYSINELNKRLEADVQFIKSISSDPIDGSESIALRMAKVELNNLRDIFEMQLLTIRREKRAVDTELAEKIDTDKSSKDKDYGPEIARLEQQQAALKEQEAEVKDLLDVAQLVD